MAGVSAVERDLEAAGHGGPVETDPMALIVTIRHRRRESEAENVAPGEPGAPV